MSAKNHLFFISAKTVDGDSLDLFVIASSKEQALAFWREAYDLDESDVHEFIGIIPGVEPTAEAGPIDWGQIRKD